MSTASLALSLLAIDPTGIGGLWLRARAGEYRTEVIAALEMLPVPGIKRLAPGAQLGEVMGGLDMAASLATGRRIWSDGIKADAATVVVPGAERVEAGLAGALAMVLDAGTHAAVLLDEGTEDDPLPAASLTDRLGLFVALEPRGDLVLDLPAIAAARERLSQTALSQDMLTALVSGMAAMGVHEPRRGLLAARVAQAHAALQARDVTEADLAIAAELSFAHLSTVPPAPEDTEAPAPPPEAPEDKQDQSSKSDAALEDQIIESCRAALPPDLLATLQAAGARSLQGSGAGQRKISHKRGRPLPSRPGALASGRRLDLSATLAAAAPWQRLRPAATGRIAVRASDIHVRRFEEQSDRVVIFVVDASGSAAAARLAEVKGAVELLLGEAYSKRDHVSLITFRGDRAEQTLPPTRSLVQTKRRLAALPGGGGTPLALGLKVALETADAAARKGMAPSLVLLTDGRANIDIDGAPGRAKAGADAKSMAARLCAAGYPAIVVDAGLRPQSALQTLSTDMGARYLPLPRADARALAAALSSDRA
ncbi:MAG: VWA domain-containing protein [Pseudomonadota bacterium]